MAADGQVITQPVTVTSPTADGSVTRGDITFAGTGTPGHPVSAWVAGPSGPVMETRRLETPPVGPDGTWSARETITAPGLYWLVVFGPGPEPAEISFTVR